MFVAIEVLMKSGVVCGQDGVGFDSLDSGADGW